MSPLLVLAILTATPAWSESVRIGVLAFRGAETAVRQWSATADYLSGEIPGHSFSIVPLDLNEWLLVCAAASPVWIIDEILKFIGRNFVLAGR